MNHKNRSTIEYITEDVRERLKNRDPVLLSQLFTEVNPYLIRVCGASGVYKEHADEVVHETWLVFFGGLDKYEERSKIRTYICGILFNKIKEFRRAQNRLVFEEDSAGSIEKSFSQDGWWKREPTDPHKISELNQASKFISDCMDGLSEQQKTAFILREVDDESSEDICNTLGVSLANLRVLIFRAKDKLKQCLEGKMATKGVP
tara:strand:+ start:9732 stop:10343 length:612 start_codon:yes stop_codon:yes gene_type:complete